MKMYVLFHLRRFGATQLRGGRGGQGGGAEVPQRQRHGVRGGRSIYLFDTGSGTEIWGVPWIFMHFHGFQWVFP